VPEVVLHRDVDGVLRRELDGDGAMPRLDHEPCRPARLARRVGEHPRLPVRQPRQVHRARRVRVARVGEVRALLDERQRAHVRPGERGSAHPVAHRHVQHAVAVFHLDRHRRRDEVVDHRAERRPGDPSHAEHEQDGDRARSENAEDRVGVFHGGRRG
jgi:hypothetical protein